MYIGLCKYILKTDCRLNLNYHHFNYLIGGYIFWCGKSKIRIICAGKENIRDKLIEMKSDKKVLQYGPDLFLTPFVVLFDLPDGTEYSRFTEINPDIISTSNSVGLICIYLRN